MKRMSSDEHNCIAGINYKFVLKFLTKYILYWYRVHNGWVHLTRLNLIYSKQALYHNALLVIDANVYLKTLSDEFIVNVSNLSFINDIHTSKFRWFYRRSKTMVVFKHIFKLKTKNV